MGQWQDCWPECWEAWGQSSISGRGEEGFDSSINWGNHRKTFISYSLLSVAQIEDDYFEECHIHFISLFMLSVSFAYTKSSPSYMSEPPLKKKKKFYGWML